MEFCAGAGLVTTTKEYILAPISFQIYKVKIENNRTLQNLMNTMPINSALMW